MKIRKSKTVEITSLEPEKMVPQTTEEFLQRAWLFYSRKKFDLAEKDYRTALEKEPENVDAIYGLALTLKAAGASTKALEFFEKSLLLLESIKDPQRAHILGRLIHGQINQIKTGDWNLEKEVWQSVH